MRTISSATASALLASRPDLAARVRPFGRRIGARVEVDLDGVRGACPSLCQALELYQSQTERLWARAASGAGSGERYVTTRRRVADHHQVTGTAGRADLREVFDAVEGLPQIGAVLQVATDTDPVLEDLSEQVGTLDGEVTCPAPGVVVLEVPLVGVAAWPEQLGGPPTPTEIGRTLVLTVRHARWRDRRVRRLARVEVFVEELFADPEPARKLLPAA